MVKLNCLKDNRKLTELSCVYAYGKWRGLLWNLKKLKKSFEKPGITFEEKAFYDILICENGYPPEWNAEACEKVLE